MGPLRLQFALANRSAHFVKQKMDVRETRLMSFDTYEVAKLMLLSKSRPIERDAMLYLLAQKPEAFIAHWVI